MKYHNVILISSLHHDDKIDASTNEKCKPEIITYYNHTKGGVDLLDKLCATYDVSRNTRRWPMVVYYAMMNIAGVNAQVIYSSNNKQYDLIRRSFLRNLALSLTSDQLTRRSFEMNVPPLVRERRQEAAGTLNTDPEYPPGTKKRCFLCKKDSKTRFYCQKCHKFLCLSHLQAWCPTCSSAAKHQ